MTRRKITILLIVFCLIFVNFWLASTSLAANASLYLAPSSGSYTVGNTFSVDMRVNTGDAAINAAQGSLVFSANELEVVSLSKAGSIFSLWTTEPAFSNSAGSINFAGGIPNPGFSGASGKIITITFKAKAIATAQVNFSSGAILANDGQGTNILASLGGGSYKISAKIISPEETKSPEVAKPRELEPAKKTSAEELTKTEVDNKPLVTSLTHPDQASWYSANRVEFKWDLPYKTTGVSILLDNKMISNPGPISDGLFSTREYSDLEDGIWYLHLKLKGQSGWSEIFHFKVQIDTVPPKAFKISMDRKGDMAWPMLYFKTSDETSSIARYEVKIDNQNFLVKAEDASLKIPTLLPGDHIAIVKAIDKAGNETLALTDFVIEPIEKPVIKNYTKELKSSDPLFISGTTLPDVTINVFIKNEKEGKITKTVSQSDKNGNWYSVYQGKLTNGRYSAWAEAVNSQGRKSQSSNKINFLVTPPVFAKIGSWVINYFAVFIILLIFTIAVLSFLAYWAGLIRNRLKKETDETQLVLHKNLKDFKKLIEKELVHLGKVKDKKEYNKNRVRIKKSFKRRADFIEKKILKEIDDIKKLLK